MLSRARNAICKKPAAHGAAAARPGPVARLRRAPGENARLARRRLAQRSGRHAWVLTLDGNDDLRTYEFFSIKESVTENFSDDRSRLQQAMRLAPKRPSNRGWLAALDLEVEAWSTEESDYEAGLILSATFISWVRRSDVRAAGWKSAA